MVSTTTCSLRVCIRYLVLADDVVYDAVLDAFLRTHYVVAVGVALYLLVGLARVVRKDLVEAPLGPDELLSVYLHVRRLPREPTDARLVQQYACIRQGVALPLGPGRQEEGAHRSRHPERCSNDVGFHEPHRVVDGQARRDAPAGRVYVDVDVLVRILALQ